MRQHEEKINANKEKVDYLKLQLKQKSNKILKLKSINNVQVDSKRDKDKQKK